MAVVIIDVPAVGIGELELSAGNQCAGHGILFLDDQGARPLIPERELLHTATHDFDVLPSMVSSFSFPD